MWIFSTPKTYSEMVEKISKSVFALSLFGFYVLSCANEDFRLFLESISFGAKYEVFGIKLNLALFYIPLCVGMAEHIFKIHDKLASLLRIRFNYDKKVIVNGFLERAKIERDLKSLDQKATNAIMSQVFYKYASSTNPVIDSHSIILTLNEWCWYWILLDSTLILLLVGIAFLVIKWSWTNLVLLLVALIVLSVIRWLIKRQTIKYTRLEIAEIWRSEERQKEIINALQTGYNLSSRNLIWDIGRVGLVVSHNGVNDGDHLPAGVAHGRHIGFPFIPFFLKIKLQRRIMKYCG